MIINDIHFKLKDGRQALLRSPREEDIPGTIDYLRQSAGETEFIIRYPEECGIYTPELEKSVFAQKNDSPCDAMIMALVDGRVAGNCDIHFYTGIKTRHRANVSIALLKDYWSLGLGTRMIEEMIRLALARPETTQMELGFIEGNGRARRLYEKMGFRIVGFHPNAIRLKNGTLLHEYMMVKTLDRKKE
ncbi:MAG: GNAT family N-acetyltransferase [Clostridia bacterium]|nr:GNAT family N-acetyltransferase [Clostridia bacterium]